MSDRHCPEEDHHLHFNSSRDNLRPGSRDTTVAFVHPKTSFGTLTEQVLELPPRQSGAVEFVAERLEVWKCALVLLAAGRALRLDDGVQAGHPNAQLGVEFPEGVAEASKVLVRSRRDHVDVGGG